jgi:DNA-binding MarR family transcriptional regulator
MSTDDRGWSDEEQLVQYLAEFGFSRNEARMYLAALGRGPLRVAELAELSDVNRPKAYDALRQLVDKGLFEPESAGPDQGQVARFSAVDPTLVVQRLRHQSALDQADRVQDTAMLVADLFARYYEAPQGDDPFEYVELIRFIDKVPMGMTAVDRRKCLLALNPTGLVSGQGSWVVLEQPALADLLTDAFDRLWDQARPAPR